VSEFCCRRRQSMAGERAPVCFARSTSWTCTYWPSSKPSGWRSQLWTCRSLLQISGMHFEIIIINSGPKMFLSRVCSTNRNLTAWNLYYFSNWIWIAGPILKQRRRPSWWTTGWQYWRMRRSSGTSWRTCPAATICLCKTKKWPRSSRTSTAWVFSEP